METLPVRQDSWVKLGRFQSRLPRPGTVPLAMLPMGHAKFYHQSFPPRRLGDQPIIASDTAARVVRHGESLLSEIPVVWGGVMLGEVQGEL